MDPTSTENRNENEKSQHESTRKADELVNDFGVYDDDDDDTPPSSLIEVEPTPAIPSCSGSSTAKKRTLGAELLPELLRMIEEARSNVKNKEEDAVVEDDTIELVQLMSSPPGTATACLPQPQRPQPGKRIDSGSAPVWNTQNIRIKRPRTDKICEDIDMDDDSNKDESMCIETGPTATEDIDTGDTKGNLKTYTVLYSKPTTKKHKTWDGDGFLTILDNGKEVILRNESNEILETMYNYKIPEAFGEGTQLHVGGKVVEIQELQSTRQSKTAQQQMGSTRPVDSSVKLSYGRPSTLRAPVFRKQKQQASTSSSVNPQASLTLRETGNNEPALEPMQEDITLNQDSALAVTSSSNSVYNVLYSKPTTKKHKTWEGDGTLTVIGNGIEVILRGDNDSIIASSYNLKLPQDFGEGTQLKVGEKIVEIQEKVEASESASSFRSQQEPRKALHPPQNVNREFRQPAPAVAVIPQFQQPKSTNSATTADMRFRILYAPTTTEKYKNWEGDGILIVTANGKHVKLTDGGNTTLEDIENFETPEGFQFEEGTQLQIGSKSIEITRRLATG